MHEAFNVFIERLAMETGYDYDDLVEAYNIATSQGVDIRDFCDDVLDGYLYGVEESYGR